MCGLLHAGILAQELLEKCLNAKGYRQITLTPGFWKHAWQPISFTLCVDDFGVKVFGKEHFNHQLKPFHENYTISIDWEGKRYLGMNLNWDHNNRKVHVSMLEYVMESINVSNTLIRANRNTNRTHMPS